MDQRTTNLYLSRILSGFFIFIHNNVKYKLIYPDISIKYEAELYAEEEYEKNKYNDWINEDDILRMLIMMEMWTPDGDTKLKSLEKTIEDTKVEIFKNFLNPVRIKSLKKSLSTHKKNYNRQYEARHSLDYITTEGYSQWLKSQYIIVNSLYDMNNNRIFKNIDSADSNLLASLCSTINEHSLDVSTFREIARSDIWRNYWGPNKNAVFDKSVVNWTDEQKTLVLITKMYDSAYEHPECPAENIIEDDDAFDGWMVFQKRENEKAKNKKRTEQILGNKLNKAGEVFLMANSKEEAQNIYSLNDQSSMNTIKERNTTILQSGQDVKETSLPDVKRDLQVQKNQMALKKGK
jgi:hypothetical protein